jgi:hypothetical protein
MPKKLTYFAVLAFLEGPDHPSQYAVLHLRQDEDERAACAAVVEAADGKRLTIVAVMQVPDEDRAHLWSQDEYPVTFASNDMMGDLRVQAMVLCSRDDRSVYTYHYRKSEQFQFERLPISVRAYHPEIAWQTAKQIANNSPDLVYEEYKEGSGKHWESVKVYQDVGGQYAAWTTSWEENAIYIVACLLQDKSLLLRNDFSKFIRDQQFNPNYEIMAENWRSLVQNTPEKYSPLALKLNGAIDKIFAEEMSDPTKPGGLIALKIIERIKPRIWDIIVNENKFGAIFEAHAVPNHEGLRRLLKTAAMEMDTAIFDPDYVAGLLMVDRINSEDIQPWRKGTTLLSGGGCVLTKRGINLFADICAAASPKEV